MTTTKYEMTTEEYFKMVEAIRDCDIELMHAKNKDYAPHDDPLANFKEFGTLGVLIRLVDKFSRLKQLHCKKNDVPGETILDTLMDIRNYCTIMEVMLEHGSEGN